MSLNDHKPITGRITCENDAMHDAMHDARHAGPFIGTDLVHIPTFAAQLATPGSTFEHVFTDRELRECSGKADRPASLAARWAAKEAYVKAWSAGLVGKPAAIDPATFDFAEVEVVQDPYGRPLIQLHGRTAQLGPRPASVSITHDGDYAHAVVALGLL